MKNIALHDSFEISQIVAGCMHLKAAQMTPESILRFTEECISSGVNTFDHAPVYGGYTCEKIFGDAVIRRNKKLRTQLKLITKTGIILPGKQGNETIYYQATKEQITKECETSLNNFGTDYIDLLLVHRPDLLAHPEETAAALDRLVEQGKVKHIGVSNYSPVQIQLLQSYMKARIVTNQVELSVKNPDNFLNGITEDAMLRRMPVMAWSPLGGGSVFAQEDEQSVRLRNMLQKIAVRYQTTMDMIMYAWLFTHPANISVVTGTMNIERVKQAVKATELKLTYDEWYQILEASRGYAVP